MAFSGSISGTKFNALKVVEHAFRRCRLNAQAITGEMNSYALENLYLLLSEMASVRTPSWCIERVVLPMYQNQPIVPLPIGTVDVLNLNYRTLQQLTPSNGGTVVTPYEYKVSWGSAQQTTTAVSTVGVKWAGVSVELTFQVSNDDVVWKTVGTQTTVADAGEWTWTDITAALPYSYFRITSVLPMVYSNIYLGNLPQEIPMGLLNRDAYVNQSNKIFPGRPATFWYQRDIPNPVVNLWPAPFEASEVAQLILWRHRQIMDTQNLQQDVEVPQRWLEAIIAKLTAKVAAETPAVDVNLIPMLEQKAAMAEKTAWDGDNDGSPIQINPGIGCYTK